MVRALLRQIGQKEQIIRSGRHSLSARVDLIPGRVKHLADPVEGESGVLDCRHCVPVGTIGGVNWHENNKDLAFSVNSAKSPSDVYSITLGTGRLDRWTTRETGGLNANVNFDPTLVKWKSFDGK